MSSDSAAIVLLALIALVLAGALVGLLITQLRHRSGAPDSRAILDQQLKEMKLELGNVTGLVRELEKDRENKFGELAARLKMVGEQTASLNSTTGALREALASTRVRGQWGERMAEDVLRLIGFVEGVNYTRQKSMDGSTSRPDFTFMLPNNMKLNMDVKFPLENYLKSCNAEENSEKERHRHAFLRDVRAHINEIATRDYIDPRQSTLACVLLFIPNEQIYQFIHEEDQSLMDQALKRSVVMCSPMTLFAILAVIRQAVDNFTIEHTSNQIISELGLFKRQWDEFLKQLQDVGRRIDLAQREYQTLLTTRRRALDRPLDRIEALRRQRGLGLPDEPIEYNQGPESSPQDSDLDALTEPSPDGPGADQSRDGD
jgi:DNA recombination protein RmuC